MAHEGLKKSGSKLASPEGAPFRGRPISGFPKPSLLSLRPLKMSASPRQNPIWKPLEKYLRTLNFCISCHSWVFTLPKGEILSPRPPLISPGVVERATSFLTMLKSVLLRVIFQNSLRPVFLRSLVEQIILLTGLPFIFLTLEPSAPRAFLGFLAVISVLS